MIQKTWRGASAIILCAAFASAPLLHAQSAPGAGVQIQQLDGKLRITIDGALFADYLYTQYSRPILYPVLGPGETPMTRNWPMDPSHPGETHDHPHHKSLWYAHGNINGIDFWSEQKGAGKTVHERFLQIKSGAAQGRFIAQDRLQTEDGRPVGTEITVVTAYDRPNERLMDYDVTIVASHGPLTFGDTKEGTMAMRLAPTLRLAGKIGRGHILNSEGVRDGQTWGKRANWCDYYGPVNGQTVGVAIFDHPSNPRHPTWWHVRDYGLFAANPFGIHYFEKNQPKGAGNFTVPAGQKITFRYRFYFHRGNTQEADVEGQYQQYVAEVKPQSGALINP